jgi:hypothetical protein
MFVPICCIVILSILSWIISFNELFSFCFYFLLSTTQSIVSPPFQVATRYEKRNIETSDEDISFWGERTTHAGAIVNQAIDNEVFLGACSSSLSKVAINNIQGATTTRRSKQTIHLRTCIVREV